MNGTIFGMTTTAKLKVSLTLSADLLATVDRNARRDGDTRSAIVERWLRRVANANAAREIDDATAAYYLGMNAAGRAESDATAHALSRAARRVAYDGVAARSRRRG
jgi:metal-responsive CopG/Arc/MetJ family transcriptional regulator